MGFTHGYVVAPFQGLGRWWPRGSMGFTHGYVVAPFQGFLRRWAFSYLPFYK